MFAAFAMLFATIISLLAAVKLIADTARLKAAELNKSVQQEANLSKEEVKAIESFLDE